MNNLIICNPDIAFSILFYHDNIYTFSLVCRTWNESVHVEHFNAQYHIQCKSKTEAKDLVMTKKQQKIYSQLRYYYKSRVLIEYIAIVHSFLYTMSINKFFSVGLNRYLLFLNVLSYSLSNCLMNIYRVSLFVLFLLIYEKSRTKETFIYFVKKIIQKDCSNKIFALLILIFTCISYVTNPLDVFANPLLFTFIYFIILFVMDMVFILIKTLLNKKLFVT